MLQYVVYRGLDMLEMKKDMMGREIVGANPCEAEEKEVKRKIEELKPAVESAKRRARRLVQLARVFKERLRRIYLGNDCGRFSLLLACRLFTCVFHR